MKQEQIDKVMMHTAYLWAAQSKCIRAKVGAVIAKEGRPIVCAYNGTPSGYKEYEEKECDFCKGTGGYECINLGQLDYVVCPKCGGIGSILIEKELVCEDKKEKLVSKCCKAPIKELLEEKIIKCSNCCKDIGFIDFANDKSGRYRIVGDFEVVEEIKTDHSKVIHAEMNAIAFAAQYGISLKDTTMYVTLSPCTECAKLIIQSGIKEVVYYEEYRNIDGLKFLEKNGVKVRKYEGEINADI
jgi:deoxycytidylate deaminase